MASRVWLGVVAAGALAVALTVPATVAAAGTSYPTGGGGTGYSHIDCSNDRFMCTEVESPEATFGHYVGHDEPSVLFYSNQAGSGNQMNYTGIIPSDPKPSSKPGANSYNFEHYATFWFGMVMCDTQSYPLTIDNCAADSNTNIRSPSNPDHPGAAYMELQFYPPGYVQQFAGFSCSATQWCIALNIDSLSINPVTGQQLNPTCALRTGLEYVNFAYLTTSGTPVGPPNPVNFNPLTSGFPDPSKVALLNPGDKFSVTLHDTAHGLETIVTDTTTGVVGKMTASAANGFGQVRFAPSPSTACQNVPYDFHPMYSTSTPQTTVPWAAATYNVAFDTEVGHFDFCSFVNAFGNCGENATEGAGSNREKSDEADDLGCFPGSASTLVKVGGCLASNIGYDGGSYLPTWPDRTVADDRPSPTIFTSPLTGPAYNINYTQAAFNTDLPDIESSLYQCDRTTGAGCNRIPLTDDGTRAAFYPYYSIGSVGGTCAWTVGQDVAGFTTNDFGRNLQYGPLQKVTYVGLHGAIVQHFNDFQQVLPTNPCPR